MALPARRRMTQPTESQSRGWVRDPLSEFDELFGRIGNLLESTVGGRAAGDAWAPLADISESADAYYVEAELPGVQREDIKVEIAERELVISGELKENERGDVTRHGTRRRTGRFEYRTLLPGKVKADEISASLKDGVLTVKAPKAPTAISRKVEISGG
ncbi:heat-shock protein Hsp20 [Wenjunlia vitaminophila]|uniref:Heat-shock protein Hsp20 n=1 Tax=Wenjunlia vitaminophila TaxID=76728 RepID=A0A0T6LYW4_WENVI|nr:Hsp20/alpha crystallin family protein [Wenjunlia vitaminophila]KRV51258.1 heat-shock protein Hsp20 [Wenjunlia vitaminophila]